MMEEESLQPGGSRMDFARQMIRVDFGYITTTWIGRVKLLEFFFVTLAGIVSPSAVSFFFSRFAFFTFIVWTSFMYIVIDLVLHILSLWRRLPQTMTSSSILIFPLLIGAVSFLIASSLIAGTVNYLQRSTAGTCGFAAACGFIVMILYCVEAFLHYQRSSRGDEVPQHEVVMRPGNPARGRPISHPIMVDIVNPPPYKEAVDKRSSTATDDGTFVAPVTQY